MSLSDARVEVDAYAKRSPYRLLDPRVKLICTVALIVVVAVLTELEAVLVAGAFALVLVIFSQVPASHLARNFALALIFILFAALTMLLYRGWESALVIGLRISVCVLLLLIMVTTTPFHKMLMAMRALRIPKLIASLLLFTYRFIFLLLDEMDRMSLARKARGFTGGRNLLDKRALKTLSNTIGMTFVRANARATNIYDALLLRGYSGELRSYERMRAGTRDAAYIAFVAVAMAMTALVEMEVLQWTF
ncbi:MAG: cobalt ECF transporter T component CbiQ [Methanomassiliicoccales archaeon]|jgi:cobalt/nickel transport system permease protein|nr:cobalt ECF transporter T component CbiQ [Methanomassiliicoccales archaeon]